MKKSKSTIESLKQVNTVVNTLLENGVLKSAKDIPVPERNIEVIETTVLEGLQEMELDQENGKRLKYLAKAKKVSIDDLFVWIEENYGKKVDKATVAGFKGKETIIQDFTKENAIGKPYNPFNNPLFASKIKKGV